MKTNTYDVVIVGGSYAGLSAAMALGRAMRKVLVIDSGLPCNRQTPHSHNFLTRDGESPEQLSAKAKEQVLAYPTVRLHQGLAVEGFKTSTGFQVVTANKEVFEASKLIFATGIKDIMPEIPGFSDCWGISVIHCPYCHGYEVRHQPTAILANGDFAYHYAQLIINWTQELTIITNGSSLLSDEQYTKISGHNIPTIEKEVASIVHHEGKVEQLVFADGSFLKVKAIYARPSFEQHCAIPVQLGCELTEAGLIKTDPFQHATVPGIFVCGDNASPMRSVANAVASGNIAGAMVNHELIQEYF